MAKANANEEKVETVWAGFADGPRAGTNLRVASPVAPWLRLAFPEWCTYRWNASVGVYEYQGTEPPPHQERSAPPKVDVSKLHIPSMDASHRETEAWKRGTREAEETIELATAVRLATEEAARVAAEAAKGTKR